MSVSIALVGPIEVFGDNAEQRYEVISMYRGRWVIKEAGWKRFGPGMDLIYEYEYNPDFVPKEGENQDGWSLVNGYHKVYVDETEYLEHCTLPDEDIIDGVVCPSWAVACKLE